jgi:hypothetical protein
MHSIPEYSYPLSGNITLKPVLELRLVKAQIWSTFMTEQSQTPSVAVQDVPVTLQLPLSH